MLVPVCSAPVVELTLSAVNLQLITNVFSKSIAPFPLSAYAVIHPVSFPRGIFDTSTPVAFHQTAPPLNSAVSNMLLTHTHAHPPPPHPSSFAHFSRSVWWVHLSGPHTFPFWCMEPCSPSPALQLLFKWMCRLSRPGMNPQKQNQCCWNPSAVTYC